MSDALLTEISKKLSDIHATLKAGGPANSGGATTKATSASPAGAAKSDANAIASDATLTPAQKRAAADKAIAAAKAKKTAETAAAAAAAAPKAGASVKGKRTVEQVREMIRAVAAKVDKQSALDILKDDGNGVEKVADLKPEYFDAVYEACEVLIAGEAKTPAPAAEEDDFA